MSNSKFTYRPNDVCVVAMGAALPQAESCDDFWQHLLNGNRLITSVTDDRWSAESFYQPCTTSRTSEQSYSRNGGFIESPMLKSIANKLGMDLSKDSRLNILATHACSEALQMFGWQERLAQKEKVDVILGCMAADEELGRYALSRSLVKQIKVLKQGKIDGWQQGVDQIKSIIEGLERSNSDEVEVLLSTSVIAGLKKQFNLCGEGYLVDAACASSHAAIDNAVYRLQQGLCDIAISGGIEADLAPTTFSLFSAVEALSEDYCFPFDVRAKGLVQGEGAVVFVLQRLEDALATNQTIYGVLKSCAGASDGRGSSLFSPTIHGQMLCYQRAYQAAGASPPDYIECHGTGTKIGDTTELKSLQGFFKNQSLIIGSSKANVGHTKGASGAVGILKCLLAMQHRVIPPSNYFSELLVPSETIHVNSKPHPLPVSATPLRMGVSSFGFGNINYHLVLDEFRSETSIRIQTTKSETNELVLIEALEDQWHEGINPIKYIEEENIAIPPSGFAQTDAQQLLGVIAVREVLKKAGIPLNELDSQSTAVIAAGITSLPKAWEFAVRVGMYGVLEQLQGCSKEVKGLLTQALEGCAPISEDTGPGILNNVVSAKVSNYFDFNGVNYNVDADFNSLSVALESARAQLNKGASLVVVISAQERLQEDDYGVILTREGVNCYLLTSLSIAKGKSLPIKRIIHSVKYREVA